jgi:hypothetical protein
LARSQPLAGSGAQRAFAARLGFLRGCAAASDDGWNGADERPGAAPPEHGAHSGNLLVYAFPLPLKSGKSSLEYGGIDLASSGHENWISLSLK